MRVCPDSPRADLVAAGQFKGLKWHEIIGQLEQVDPEDTSTIKQILDFSIAAAKHDPEAQCRKVAPELRKARDLFYTDREAALKLLDDTAKAQTLLMLMGASDLPSIAAGGNSSCPIAASSRSHPTSGSDNQSASELTVASVEKTW